MHYKNTYKKLHENHKTMKFAAIYCLNLIQKADYCSKFTNILLVTGISQIQHNYHILKLHKYIVS